MTNPNPAPSAIPARFPYTPRRGVPVAVARAAWGEVFEIPGPSPRPFALEGSVAVVDIKGPLEQHAGWFCDSYDAIRARVGAALAASEADAVVLRINSPGGDFAGSIELAGELRAAADAAGKRLIAYTDSSALSAAYAIACACDEIVVAPSAFVGSVGVWAPLIDETARDKAMGLAVVIVASGTRKVDRNPHVGITEDAVAAMQAQVDTMAGMFFGHVATRRGMGLAAIEALQGSEQLGAEAVSRGLADRVVQSWGEFLTYASNRSNAMADDNMKKAREALAAIAGGDDEMAKKARRALAVFDEEKKEEAKAYSDGDNDGDGDKKEAKAADDGEKAKAEDEDGKEAKAESEDKKEEARAAARAGGPRLVATSTPRELDLAARVHALETERVLEKETAERNALLAGRPDFAPEVRASLEGAPLDFVRKACKTWKRGAVSNPAAAVTPRGTRGDSQGVGEETTSPGAGFVGLSEADYIAEKMGMRANHAGITAQGNSLVLGHMTPAEAAERAAKLAAKEGA